MTTRTSQSLRRKLIAAALSAAFLMALPAAGGAEIVIPASWGYPLGSQDSTAAGFTGRIHQARRSAGLTATIARGNAQLNGTLIDPDTGQAYLNLAVTTTNAYSTNGLWFGKAVKPDGSFIETNVINYAADNLGLVTDIGNFTIAEGYIDATFPGLPGSVDSTFTTYENGANIAIEIFAFLELRAGLYTLGVHSDDTFELAMHANDPRDIFRKSMAAFDSNRGGTETTTQLRIEADGLYPIRLLHTQFANSAPAQLELYTVDANDPSLRTLVNDRLLPRAVKAWRTLTRSTRPYVRSVSPAPGSTGVGTTTAVEVGLVNLGTNTPVLKVNGATVTYTRKTEGDQTTLTYTPATAFAGGSTINVEVNYAGAVGTWSYVTRTGRKALLITGGGQVNASDAWISQRLASMFGLDVTVVSDAAVTTNDAAGVVLVVNSSTVSSGQVANDHFEELPIPLVNWEGGNLDDFLMHPGNTFGNDNNVTEIEIVNEAHPIAAGLKAGVHKFSTANVQVHWGSPDELSTTLVGINPASPTHALLFAIEKGAVVGDFTHPERRVHLGFIGNTGASTFNDTGVKLFDAAIKWVLPPEATPPKPPKFDPPAWAAGKLTISWTGTATLEEAPAVTGPWTRASNQTTPQTITAAGSKFFRLRQ